MNVEAKKELLMHSRHLVHTSYDVTAIQNRIFYYCLFNAQKEKSGNLKCTISLDEIKRLIPNKNSRTLANVKKIIKTLSHSSLEFERKDERDDDTVECAYTLIAASKYYREKEIFEITFLEDLYEHIINYRVYAPLDLEIMFKFQSFYSQRLYELLRLWSRTSEVVEKEFTIDQLRFILGVENKYPEYKNFKQRVLSQAVREINNFGNMNLEIKEIKKNRKTNSIKFTIMDHGKRKLSEVKCETIEQLEISIANDGLNPNKILKDDKDFYVPNKKLFTQKTLLQFKNDFREYDFKDFNNKKILQEVITITLEKDDEEKVKDKAYEYLKTTLEDRLSKYSKSKDNNHKAFSPTFKTRFHNHRQTFTKYDPDELEQILFESQKDKFK